jgi:hypothetical protein
MKLYGLLFEGVSRDKVILGIRDMIKSSSRTGNYFFSLIGMALDTSDFYLKMSKIGRFAEDFYETNRGEFDKIFRMDGADSFEYLSGGDFGNAFSIGDKILKIELEPEGELSRVSSGARAAKAARALFGGAADLGSIVPMIYDQGYFVYPPESGIKINWIIMERFEPLKGAHKSDMGWVITKIVSKIKSGEPIEDIKNIENYDAKVQNLIGYLGPELRLKSGWFGKLVDAMVKLQAAEMKDFHSGNIGVRRVGPEGELVFFD